MKRTFSKKLLALLLVVVMAVALVPAAAFAADEPIAIDATPTEMTGEWVKNTSALEFGEALLNWAWNWDVKTVESNLDEADVFKLTIKNSSDQDLNYVVGSKYDDNNLYALNFRLDGEGNTPKTEVKVKAHGEKDIYVYAKDAEKLGIFGKKNTWNGQTIVVVRSLDKETGYYDNTGNWIGDSNATKAVYRLKTPANPTERKSVFVAAFKILSTNTIRVAGADRVATSIEAAKFYQLSKTSPDWNLYYDWENHKFKWQDDGKYEFKNLIFACANDFPDALSASFLSYATNAPIVLVNDAQQAEALALVDDLVSGGQVFIMGGAAVVPEAFEKAVDEKIGAENVHRLGGADRYETNMSALLAAIQYQVRHSRFDADQLIIATGKNFPDALSASALGCPILLVDEELTAQQKDFLTLGNLTKAALGLTDQMIDEMDDAWFDMRPFIVGGIGAVNTSIELELNAMYNQSKWSHTVQRLGGSDRYETSAAIANALFDKDYVDTLVIATGKDFPDALVAGPIAKFYHAPICLVDEGNTTSAAKFADDQHRLIVMGGTGAVSEDTVAALELAK